MCCDCLQSDHKNKNIVPPIITTFIIMNVTFPIPLSLPFSYSPSPPTPPSLSRTLLIVQVIEMVKDHILPYASKVPQQFLEQLTMVLNRGSIHSVTDNADGEHNKCMHTLEWILTSMP